MVAQTPCVLPDFLRDAFYKCVCQAVIGAGKHQVLPDEETHFIAQIEKVVVGIVAAAPDPAYIEVGVFAGGKKLPGPLAASPREDIVLGDVIRAHGEEGPAVYDCREALAPFILSLKNRGIPETDPENPFICVSSGEIIFRAISSGAISFSVISCGVISSGAINSDVIIFRADGDFQCIKRLVTQSVRPPEFRVRHAGADAIFKA